MLHITQLHAEVGKLLSLYKATTKEVDDPLYIAWIIDAIFAGKVPAAEQQVEFSEIMNARKSAAFKTFWSQYKVVKSVMDQFQIVNMGVIPEADRIKYQRKFVVEHKQEVPF